MDLDVGGDDQLRQGEGDALAQLIVAGRGVGVEFERNRIR